MSEDLESSPAGPEREGTAETFIRALYEDTAGPVFNFVLRLTGDDNYLGRRLTSRRTAEALQVGVGRTFTDR